MSPELFILGRTMKDESPTQIMEDNEMRGRKPKPAAAHEQSGAYDHNPNRRRKRTRKLIDTRYYAIDNRDSRDYELAESLMTQSS
jgi:hypothetical protein